MAEQLTRQLTRDSTALLTAVLTSAGPAAADSAEAMDEDAPPPPVQATVGTAGRAALSSPVLARPLLVLLFRSELAAAPPPRLLIGYLFPNKKFDTLAEDSPITTYCGRRDLGVYTHKSCRRLH